MRVIVIVDDLDDGTECDFVLRLGRKVDRERALDAALDIADIAIDQA